MAQQEDKEVGADENYSSGEWHKVIVGHKG